MTVVGVVRTNRDKGTEPVHRLFSRGGVYGLALVWRRQGATINSFVRVPAGCINIIIGIWSIKPSLVMIPILPLIPIAPITETL